VAIQGSRLRLIIHWGDYNDCEGGTWCNSQTLVCTAFRK